MAAEAAAKAKAKAKATAPSGFPKARPPDGGGAPFWANSAKGKGAVGKGAVGKGAAGKGKGQSKEQIRAAIAAVPCMADLTEEAREAVVAAVTEVKFEADDVVIKQGAEADCMYMVQSGELEASVSGAGVVNMVVSSTQGDGSGASQTSEGSFSAVSTPSKYTLE